MINENTKGVKWSEDCEALATLLKDNNFFSCSTHNQKLIKLSNHDHKMIEDVLSHDSTQINNKLVSALFLEYVMQTYIVYFFNKQFPYKYRIKFKKMSISILSKQERSDIFLLAKILNNIYEELARNSLKYIIPYKLTALVIDLTTMYRHKHIKVNCNFIEDATENPFDFIYYPMFNLAYSIIAVEANDTFWNLFIKDMVEWYNIQDKYLPQ